MFFLMDDDNLVNQFYIIWRESVFELNGDERTLFLFYLKNSLEYTVIEGLVPNFASYEDVRFQLRGYNDIVCVNTVCNSCQIDSCIGLHIIKYLDWIFLNSE
jgi:hypothetical protein